MKTTSVLYVLGLACGATAFHGAASSNIARSSTALSAEKPSKKSDIPRWAAPLATTMFGLTLASQAAFSLPEAASGNSDSAWESSSSVVMAVEKLDFSMPSYDGGSSSGGFGDGVEAYLGKNGDSSDETQKQIETMRKAEEARQARKAAKAAEMKMQEQINKQQALEKKQKNAEKTRAFFAGEY